MANSENPNELQFFKIASDIVDYAIISLDTNGTIENWNKGAELMKGYKANEIIGKNFSLFFTQEDIIHDKPKKLLQESYLYGKATDEGWRVKRDGSLFWVKVSISAIYDDEHVVIGYMKITTDLTDRRKNELAILATNHTNAMIAFWDRNLVCRFANDSYMEWFGKSHSEMIDKIILPDLLGPLYDKNLPFITEALKGNSQVFEREIKTPSGEIRHALASYSPEIINGEVKGFFAHVSDISAIKRLEISLAKSQKKFKKLMESAPDAVVIVNQMGVIDLVNQQIETIFGYSKDEVTGQSINILLPERYKKDHMYSINGYFAQPKVRPMGQGIALYARKKNGQEFPVEISLSPIETDEGMLVSASIRDITEHVEREKKLQESKDELQVLADKLIFQNAQLASFAQITSHNLRSPVGNLNALLHFYKEADTIEEKNLMFSKFEIVVHHLSSTLNSLVEVLKIKDKTDRKIETISFKDVLEKTKEILSGQLIETNASIQSDFSNAPQVDYDRNYLESIFLNLISNAIKYRSPDRIPEIIIKAEKVNNKLLLSFRDNGLGIDLAKHGSKLFGFHKTFHRHPEAQGVGLFITKTQIESMGGTISAISEVGKGTTFTIIF